MVDVVFSDVAQPDQARIIGMNASNFLKTGGYMLVAVKANCIDSVSDPKVVFAQEIERLREEKFFPIEQLSINTYQRDHCFISAK